MTVFWKKVLAKEAFCDKIVVVNRKRKERLIVAFKENILQFMRDEGEEPMRYADDFLQAYQEKFGEDELSVVMTDMIEEGLVPHFLRHYTTEKMEEEISAFLDGYDVSKKEMDAVFGALQAAKETMDREKQEKIDEILRRAQGGDPESMVQAAKLYLSGEGVAQSEQKCLSLLEGAIERGSALAIFEMAELYKEGEIVPRDLKKAWAMYEEAAGKDCVQAQYAMGYCYANEELVEEDQEQAFYWYKKAAENGYAKAQNNLGNCYKNGKGVQQDYMKAMYWYKKAAEQGNKAASANLTKCVENDTNAMYTLGMEELSRGDREAAMGWFKKAGKRNHIEAICQLGDMVEDEELSRRYYKVAARLGSAVANRRLGDLEQPRDEKKAMKYYKAAAKAGDEEAPQLLAQYYSSHGAAGKSKGSAQHWLGKKKK